MLESADLHRLLRALPGMFVLLRCDADFTIVAASADYLHTSHTDASIYGRPLFDVFPDNPSNDDRAGSRTLRASLARVLATREADRMAVVRYDVQRSDGSGFEQRYWLAVNTPLLADDGSVEFIVHRVEEAAAKAHRKAVEILESITEGFFTLDRKWRFDYVNAEAHRILDIEPDALTGRVIWEVYPGLDNTPFWDCYHRTMDTRVKTTFTAYYAAQQRWYDVTVFPAPEGISAYFRNVTERKLLDARREALADLSQRLGNAPDAALAGHEGAAVLGTALMASRVGYGTVDHDSGNLSVDKDWTRPGVASLAGITPLLDYGTFIHRLRRGELIAIDDVRADPTTAAAAAALEAKQARAFVNFPVMERGRLVAVLFVNDDKVRHWTADDIAFIQEAAARTRMAVERAKSEQVLRDSEATHRLLSAELADAGRMKDEFLATLAHELRNPLAPIRNALTIQHRANNDPAVMAQTRELMQRQVAHMVRLIDDLLDLSRLSRGVIDLQLERVPLAPAIRLALDACRPLVEQSRHELAVSLPGEELAVSADPVRMAQIVTNLINNAAKFTPAGGKLAVSLERDGDLACVRVRDNGIGLRADMLQRVFRMFEQVDRSHAHAHGGLGIGLTLVQQLVEAQGGSVVASSAGLGAGSEFTVRLPLLPAMAEAAAVPSDAAPPASSTTPQRVLIADDNVDAAESLAMLLEMAGYETCVATDGAQAIALATTFLPQAVVLDIAMPVVNGLDAARAIRALPNGQRTLLLALSGFGQQSDKQRSADAGFDEHLTKPVDLDGVINRINAHLARG